MQLAEKQCKPCRRNGMQPLAHAEASLLLQDLDGWELTQQHDGIHKHFTFSDFKHALAFVTKVAQIAEDNQHHPDITFGWGYCDISLSTHAIKGLHENDFIIAAKIDTMVSGKE